MKKTGLELFYPLVEYILKSPTAKAAQEYILPFAKNFSVFEFYKDPERLGYNFEVFQTKLLKLIEISILENTAQKIVKYEGIIGSLEKAWQEFNEWLHQTNLSEIHITNLKIIITELIRHSNQFISKENANSQPLPPLTETAFIAELKGAETTANFSLEFSPQIQNVIIETLTGILGREISFAEIVEIYNQAAEVEQTTEEILEDFIEICLGYTQGEENLSEEELAAITENVTYEFFAHIFDLL